MTKNDNQLGLITEVGDLGLGFEPLSEQDIEKLKTKKDNNKEE